SSQPRISFQHFLREEMAFKSVYQLVNQIKKDIQRAKNLLLTD
ncbi:MAG: riboflavin biosynthesis protein RibF, partial [Aquificae bacterium]|nr:riboflavin biosynthesis protein RibF [Aquificota bacterium]